MSDIDIDAGPKVMGDDDRFHAEDEAVDLAGTPFEAWLSLAFFWALGLTVFFQFITRYVLNDSAAWTEEIARYLLIAVVFVGAGIGVSKNTHIQVDFFYRYMPKAMARAMAIAVDLARFAFFAAAVVLTWQMMQKMDFYRMTLVDLPMNIVYGVCLAGFALMTLRAAHITVIHWRRGYSVLERPETSIHDE